MVDLGVYAGVAKLAVSGFFGVIVRMLHLPNADWKKWLIEIVTGMASCIYLTPLAVYYLSIPTKLEYGVGFLIGYSGIAVASMVYEKIKGVGSVK